MILLLLYLDGYLLDQKSQSTQISIISLLTPMKWYKVIKDGNKFPNQSPLVKLASGSASNQSRDLALKSIQKIKLEASISKLHKNISSSSITSKDQKIKKLLSKKFSQYPSRQLMPEFQSVAQIQDQLPNKEGMQEILGQFKKQFSDFMKKFVEKVTQGKSKVDVQQMAKKLISLSQQTINTYFQPKSQPNNIRKSISCVQNGSYIFKDKLNESKKRQSAIMKFKKQIVQERNNFTKIENSLNQVHAILVKQKRVPRFSRTSRMQNQRSGDSSVQQVIERSLSESKRVHKSRLKSKDLLYNMSKVLNQRIQY